MATVTASKYGFVSNSSEFGWSSARDAATGNSIQNQSTSTNTAQVAVAYASGSKGSSWDVKRQFLAFNVTAYQTGYTITSLKLYYLPTTSTQGSSGTGMKMALIQSTAQGNANADLTTADFDSFSMNDYAANDGSTDNTWRDLAVLSSVDLNATAITAITGTGYLKICIMEYLYDYPDSAPGSVLSINGSANFNTVPYLSFTATPEGYGNDIIGVGYSDIGEVISVASADISEVIGV